VVREVTANDATVTIVRAPKGVKPEDKVRAVFDESELEGAGVRADVRSGRVRESRPRRGGRSRKGNALISLILLFGIFSLFQGKSGAEDLRGDVTAQAGFSPELPRGPGGVDGSIRITWDPSKMAYGKNVVEYHIYRDGVLVAAPQPGLGLFDDDCGAAVRAVSYSLVDPLTNTRTITTANVARPSQGWPPHEYAVSAVYQSNRIVSDGQGNTVVVTDYFETPRKAAGAATIIKKMVRTDLIEPVYQQPDVDPTEGITFQWKARSGADSYIIQISSSPTFVQPEYTSPVISFSPNASDDDLIPPYLATDIGTALDNIPGETLVYWRVGARYSGDSPGPMPVGPSRVRYLFSEASSFYKAESPPPPKGG